MTRINSAIPVKNLTDEHLLAEHREIKRLPYCLAVALESGSVKHIPEKFTLGKGHVLFFLNKMWFTYWRYCDINTECLVRGFYVDDYSENWDDWKDTEYFEHPMYEPTEEERNLLIERITYRILNSKKKTWHYYGKPITKEKAVELLKNKVL